MRSRNLEVSTDRRRILPTIYTASFLLQLAHSLSAAFIPLYALELGADVVQVGLIVAAGSLGGMLYNLPGGFLIGTRRTRPMLAVGMLGASGAALFFGLAPSSGSLLVAGLLLGISSSQVNLTRLTFLRRNIPGECRGRVLSRLGGLFRLGRICGPLIGGLVIDHHGFRAVFFVHSVTVLLAMLVVLLFLPGGRDPETTSYRENLVFLKAHITTGLRNMVPIIVGITGLSMIRMSRQILFPLWANQLNLSVSILGVVMSIATFAELIPVIPAGWILDNKGRKWTLIPAMIIMMSALCLLPAVASLVGFVLAAVLFGIGNGFGTGITMTLGTDLAPREATAQFLGLWRFVNNGATTLGPLLVGLISRSLSLTWSPLILAGIGAVAIITVLDYKDPTISSTSVERP